MSNEIPSDLFGLNDAFKKIADAWNEGLEQVQRVNECKMRRFYSVSGIDKTKVIHEGVVYPDYVTVIQNRNTKALQIFRSFDNYTDTHRYSQVQWIDAEPEGWHLDPEASK